MDAPHSPGIFCPRLALKPPSSALISPDRVSEIHSSALAHFSSIPWTSALINPGRDANVETVAFTARGMVPMVGKRDLLVRSTLFKPQGLEHMLCFVRKADVAELLDPARLVRRLFVLFSLGEGLTGHVGIIHGGMLATMADEAMGALHDFNAALDKKDPAYAVKQLLTVELNIKFLKPARVGDVLAEAWIESVIGRKIVMGCEIRDNDGVLLTKCTATWISPRSKL